MLEMHCSTFIDKVHPISRYTRQCLTMFDQSIIAMLDQSKIILRFVGHRTTFLHNIITILGIDGEHLTKGLRFVRQCPKISYKFSFFYSVQHNIQSNCIPFWDLPDNAWPFPTIFEQSPSYFNIFQTVSNIFPI